MKKKFKAAASILLSASLTLLPLGCGGRRATPPVIPLTRSVFDPLQDTLKKSYLALFDLAPKAEYSSAQREKFKEYLDQAEEYCVSRFKERADQYNRQMESTQSELREKSGTLSEEERHEIHCQIQNARILKSQATMLAEHAIPVAYDNKRAKLRLIEEWPQDLRRIRQAIRSGSYLNRKFGDVKDIGFRKLGEGQEEDVKDGRDAIERMKQQGVLPPEIKNDYIRKYVTDLAEKIARKSDLRVPVKVTLLNSKEANAFALPGGFLFLQRGLLEAAEDEAQLAGVIAHETAHAAARHGHQLLKRATIASIFYQAAQIAAVVLTGGVAGLGTYYALQYGFYGLGLILNLDLLGVSRDFELEADQLGVQYAWNSDYDTSGFIRFFDKMATTEGYVNGASWFRTHPPFYERMVKAKEEIMYLPQKSDLITNNPDFRRMKDELAKVTAEAKREETGKPSLLSPEQGCRPPNKLEYEPGQPIDAICSIPIKTK